jgi:tRNA pseudouridine55 synthase
MVTMKPSSFHGLLVVDKPGGMTSRDVVNRAQGWFPRGTRIGHTGTLDPLATGVLVLCVGVATRLAEYVQDMDKTYRAGLRLGARSDTDDAEGVIATVPVERVPDGETIAQQLQGFIGELEQVPPAYSAAKVTGHRAYELARQGKEVALRPRRVRIYSIGVLAYEYPRLDLEVRCGKGTYIRSLARDLGERLGCGAFIQTLRRTRVGPFEAAGALTPEAEARTARARLLPVSAAVGQMEKLTLDAGAVARLRRGGTLLFNDPPLRGVYLPTDGEIAIFAPSGELALVAVVDTDRCVLRPAKVLMGLAESPETRGPE